MMMIIACFILGAASAFIAGLFMLLFGWSWSSVIEVYFAIGVISFLSTLVLHLIFPDQGDIFDEISFQIAALREMKDGDGNKDVAAQHDAASTSTANRTESGSE